uniref:Uncharacterized protein n=1 Tax=Solibacter usitatus (strain Ellin6076) TaxID=234267 RepID=Q023U8_SOLUE
MDIRIAVGTATVLTAFLPYSATKASSVTAPPLQPRLYAKASTSKTRIQTSVPDFVIWVDETKWKQEESDTPGMLTFAHLNSDMGTAVLTDRLGFRAEVMRDVALEAFQRGDPNAKITSEEKRIVNGRQVLAFEISAKVEGVPSRIFGYSHGGASGDVEILGMIPVTQLTENNIADVTEFLNGLEMSDKELPSTASREIVPQPGNLFVNPKVSIKYDPAKWNQEKVDEAGSSFFTHSGGDAYVKVLSDRTAPPFDALPEMILTNAQNEDPNAKLVLKEKRKVNGADVWFLKLDREVHHIPMIVSGYYYTGKSGTVLVMTMTGKNQYSKFEKDFMDFLNGLSISE